MKFKKLGNTDLKVSLICLGTMTWGEQNSQEDAFEQMDYALDKGVNFFDTAEMYAVPSTKESFGKTEAIIGNWFKKRNNREKVILATKVSGPGQTWVRGGGLQYTKENITAALEGSLKRLKTNYIDLYQLHWPERNTNFFGKLGYKHEKEEKEWNSIESVLEVLKQFVEQGKIRYIGLSNESAWGLSKFLELSKSYNLPRVMSVQNPYNLLNRTYEIGLAEISIREQSGLLAYSPLASGVLTGKYRDNQKPKGSRLQLFPDYFPRYYKKLSFLAVEEYFKVAQKRKISLTQLSLAFVNQQPFVTSNIIGATTIKQLKENIESVDCRLSYEIINEINLIHKNNPNPAP
jgi:aryl-alcohol dehydrogenase-like predicted oxidoreductase